jgi:hypothetical protein
MQDDLAGANLLACESQCGPFTLARDSVAAPKAGADLH